MACRSLVMLLNVLAISQVNSSILKISETNDNKNPKGIYYINISYFKHDIKAIPDQTKERPIKQLSHTSSLNGYVCLNDDESINLEFPRKFSPTKTLKKDGSSEFRHGTVCFIWSSHFAYDESELKVDFTELVNDDKKNSLLFFTIRHSILGEEYLSTIFKFSARIKNPEDFEDDSDDTRVSFIDAGDLDLEGVAGEDEMSKTLNKLKTLSLGDLKKGKVSNTKDEFTCVNNKKSYKAPKLDGKEILESQTGIQSMVIDTDQNAVVYICADDRLEIKVSNIEELFKANRIVL